MAAITKDHKDSGLMRDKALSYSIKVRELQSVPDSVSLLVLSEGLCSRPFPASAHCLAPGSWLLPLSSHSVTTSSL